VKKLRIGLTIFYLVSLIFFFACNSNAPTGPDDPNDNEVVEHYDYTIIYIRPPGSIVRPEMSDPLMFTAQYKNGVRPTSNLTKVNDYEFTGTLVGVPTHLKKEATLLPNYIYVVDAKRWIDMWDNGYGLLWGRPHSIGDIFKLKNNKTGAELILNNIVANILNPTWPPQCEPKAAQFWTIKGGLIKNAWPY